MTNDRLESEVADLLDMVPSYIHSIARVRGQHVALTGTATARQGRGVLITVNADGMVIETRFADDIDELDYDEIADAVTEATQEVAGRAEELIAPIRATLSPGLSSMAAGLSGLRTKSPGLRQASFDSPAAWARQESGDSSAVSVSRSVTDRD